MEEFKLKIDFANYRIEYKILFLCYLFKNPIKSLKNLNFPAKI